jgi:hypothetical protein
VTISSSNKRDVSPSLQQLRYERKLNKQIVIDTRAVGVQETAKEFFKEYENKRQRSSVEKK